MADIKTFVISGPAATAMAGGAQAAPKRRRNTKKNQEGGVGDEQVRGVSSVMNIVKGVESSPLAAASAPPQSSTWLKYPVGAPVPPQTPMPQAGGTTKHIKVELKKKATTKKVHLNPKKPDAQHKQSKKHQTKKHRKVTLGVSSLHRRITHAKKLSKEVKSMPLDKLKDKLVKGGLIKPTSKAPESLLRSIAADAAVVNKKAL